MIKYFLVSILLPVIGLIMLFTEVVMNSVWGFITISVMTAASFTITMYCLIKAFDKPEIENDIQN